MPNYDNFKFSGMEGNAYFSKFNILTPPVIEKKIVESFKDCEFSKLSIQKDNKK